jgi:hypothetical protein
MLMNRKCEILKGPPYGFEKFPLVNIEKWNLSRSARNHKTPPYGLKMSH